MDPIAKARMFQQMHVAPEILVIANAWDAASARVFEDEGMRAIGTGSAGIAFSHGYPDNERIPREVLIKATAEIVRSVELPVTADRTSSMSNSRRKRFAPYARPPTIQACRSSSTPAPTVSG
jgi:2-methylisocitrate lyase-like PEP mutase family enzyme